MSKNFNNLKEAIAYYDKLTNDYAKESLLTPFGASEQYNKYHNLYEESQMIRDWLKELDTAKENNTSEPKHHGILYRYNNMSHGEFRLAILHIIEEHQKYYDVINEFGVKTSVYKSTIEYFSTSGVNCFNCILYERDDERAKKILREYEMTSLIRQQHLELHKLCDSLDRDIHRIDCLAEPVNVYEADEYKNEQKENT